MNYFEGAEGRTGWTMLKAENIVIGGVEFKQSFWFWPDGHLKSISLQWLPEDYKKPSPGFRARGEPAAFRKTYDSLISTYSAKYGAPITPPACGTARMCRDWQFDRSSKWSVKGERVRLWIEYGFIADGVWISYDFGKNAMAPKTNLRKM
jgi:hypothetical protein